MMLNDVECETFNLFVKQISKNLFVISFQLMFHKTMRYHLPRALKVRSVGIGTVLNLKKKLCQYLVNVL